MNLGGPPPNRLKGNRHRPRRDLVEHSTLSERYRLSPRETRVALLIADGHTAREIATLLGVTVFTIRAHLRSIFAKTDVTRQATLVRLVLTTSGVRERD